MPPEDVVYIKLSYAEALQTKKSILSSELNSMNISRIITRYGDIRMKELALKSRAYWKIKETKKQIRKLQSFLPGLKIPSLMRLERKIIREEEHLKTKIDSSYDEGDIESQLREIQRRLSDLQG